jgi:hypothetical protein
MDQMQIVALIRETADKRGCANFDAWAEAKTGDAECYTLTWTGGRRRRVVFSGCSLIMGRPSPEAVINATLKAITSMDEELVTPKVKTTAPLHDAVFGMRG